MTAGTAQDTFCSTTDCGKAVAEDDDYSDGNYYCSYDCYDEHEEQRQSRDVDKQLVDVLGHDPVELERWRAAARLRAMRGKPVTRLELHISLIAEGFHPVI